MDLNWIKCGGENWCNLLIVNLAHPNLDDVEGVYIIWHGQPDPAVVYVGQGIIRDRLTQHRNDPRILAFREQGLYVTWAKADSAHKDGVERFLADTWQPKVGDNHPQATPIPVNSPW